MKIERNHPALMDDKLFPPHSIIVRGKYRGRRHRIFVHRKPGQVIERTTLATPNGWYRGAIVIDGHVVYQSRATRTLALAREIAFSIEIQHG